MKVHTLKEGEPDYGDVVSGKKQVEIRPAEMGFEVGDLLMICQFINNNFTGLDIEKKVAYIKTEGEGIPEGCVLLGLEDCKNSVDSSIVPVKVNREGFDFLSRTMFGDCPHCGKHITRDTSPESCCECGSPILWGDSPFGAL